MGIQRNTILETCYRFCLPLARLMLGLGISHREFAEALKRAYVEVASRDFGSRGKFTNTSRVAVMTGLTRKEVRRLKESLALRSPFEKLKSGPAQAVIDGWLSDPDMLDGAGKPRALGLGGTSSGFSELVRRYGGDLPPGAVAAELRRTGVVRQADSGELTLAGRYYPPRALEPALVRRIAVELEACARQAQAQLPSSGAKP